MEAQKKSRIISEIISLDKELASFNFNTLPEDELLKLHRIVGSYHSPVNAATIGRRFKKLFRFL